MAKVNWYRQLGLALVLFIFGSVAYWMEFKHKPQKEDQEELSKKIFPLKESPIESIQWIQNGQAVTLKCSDLAQKLCKSSDRSKWEISQPTQMKADDTNVSTLLDALISLSTSETIQLKSETPEKRAALLKEYHLDAEARKTAVQVRLQPQDGKVWTLFLGETHPMGDSQFVLLSTGAAGDVPGNTIDETKVFLIPSHFKSNLEHDLNYWRNKKLFTLAAHEVDAFDLKSDHAQVKAQRNAGQWLVGADAPGDSENIQSFLSSATYLVAKSFIAENKKEPKAQAALKSFKPLLELKLQREKGTATQAPEPIVLNLYQKTEKTKNPTVPPVTLLYATVSNLDPLFELDISSKVRIDKDLKDFRLAKLLTSMERFAAKKIEFSGAQLGASWILEEIQGKWASVSPKQEIDADKVSALLEQFSGNRIQNFLTGAQIPKGQETGLHFVLRGPKNEAQKELIFWKDGTRLIAKDLASKRAEVFVVDPILVSVLPWTLEAFQKAPPAPPVIQGGHGKT